MDQRVTFQTETQASDGQGGFTSSSWDAINSTPTMWARVEVSDGREGDEGELRQANVYSIKVTVRNRSDIDETMRLVWRGRAYNIRSIEPYDARRDARAIVAEGGVPL